MPWRMSMSILSWEDDIYNGDEIIIWKKMERMDLWHQVCQSNQLGQCTPLIQCFPVLYNRVINHQYTYKYW